MRKPTFRIVLALSLLAAPFGASAQGAGASVLTLQEAVELARRSHPLAQAAGGRRQVVEGRARNDAMFPNPLIEVRRENVRSPIARDEFVTATLPVDLTGRRFALRAASSRAAVRGAADSTIAVRQVEFEAARAWVRHALLRGLSEVAHDQRIALERIAEFDGKRFAEGAIAEAAALRGRLEADRARLTAAQAAGDAARAQADFVRAIGGAPAGGTIPSAGPLPSLVALAAFGEESTFVARALSQRPELAGARAALRETELRERAEGLGVLPDVGIQAGYKGTGGYQTALLGVAFALPVMNWNGGARERAAGERRIAEAELRDLEAKVRAEASAAWHMLREMTVAIAAIGPDLDARAAIVSTSAEAAYREGATTQLEVLEAQRARAEARATALRATADLLLARLELNRAVGAQVLEDR